MRRARSASSFSSRPGDAILHRPRDQRGHLAQLVAPGCHEESQVSVDPGGLVGGLDGRCQALGRRAVVGAALPELGEQLGKLCRGEQRRRKDHAASAGNRVRRPKAERPPEVGEPVFQRVGAEDPAPQAVALVDELVDRALVTDVAGLVEDERQRLAERTAGVAVGLRQDALARLDLELARAALVEDLEVAGDIGLEGELVEEALAKGVNGLNLEPAGGFKRAGEQPAGNRQHRRIRPPPFDPLDRRGELLVVERRPLGEVVEDPLRHLGGGGLGEGQAEDAAGIVAGKQEPLDAAGEDEGLARPGIGRDPGRGGRIRRRRLRLLGRRIDRT